MPVVNSPFQSASSPVLQKPDVAGLGLGTLRGRGYRVEAQRLAMRILFRALHGMEKVFGPNILRLWEPPFSWVESHRRRGDFASISATSSGSTRNILEGSFGSRAPSINHSALATDRWGHSPLSSAWSAFLAKAVSHLRHTSLGIADLEHPTRGVGFPPHRRLSFARVLASLPGHSGGIRSGGPALHAQ